MALAFAPSSNLACDSLASALRQHLQQTDCLHTGITPTLQPRRHDSSRAQLGASLGIAGGCIWLLRQRRSHGQATWRGWHQSRRAKSIEGEVGDWRDFRARLLASENQDDGEGEDDDCEVGWIHVSPILERGSVLLACPGDHFALDRQQFIKSIVLIIEHSHLGDVGLLLNRPTSLTTVDLGFGNPPWKVWFGGAAESLRTELQKSLKLRCIHSLELLADSSTELVPDIFLIDFDEALLAVKAGVADMGDFVTFAGSCQWGAGELQKELDSGEVWTLVSTSKEVLRECLLSYQNVARFAGTQSEFDDGTSNWKYLNEMLGSEFVQREEAAIERNGGQLDDLLIRWITRNLRYPLGYDDEVRQSEALTMGATGEQVSSDILKVGTVLYASACSWLLDMPWGPASTEAWGFNLANLQPCQYLHRGVLALVSGGRSQSEPATLVLLNGPMLSDPNAEIFFGGPFSDENAFREFGSSVRKLGPEGRQVNVAGCVVLEPGLLEALVQCGALKVAEEGITAEDLLANPCTLRWDLAGGKLSSIPEMRAAGLGDMQRQRWFKRFKNLDLMGEWA